MDGSTGKGHQHSALSKLHVLDISDTSVKDLSPLSALTELKDLSLRDIPVDDLTPLLALTWLKKLDMPMPEVMDLEDLDCHLLYEMTSVLPLGKCRKLKRLVCFSDARDCGLLKERRPDIRIMSPYGDEEGVGGGGGSSR